MKSEDASPASAAPIPEDIAARFAAQLHVADIIPISARTGENIGEELIPAIIETSPEAALALGRELPRYRRQAAQKLGGAK